MCYRGNAGVRQQPGQVQLLNDGYANQMLHGDMQQVCLYLDLFHLLSTRERSDRGNPQSTLMYCIRNVHTHSNGTTELFHLDADT